MKWGLYQNRLIVRPKRIQAHCIKISNAFPSFEKQSLCLGGVLLHHEAVSKPEDRLHTFEDLEYAPIGSVFKTGR